MLSLSRAEIGNRPHLHEHVN